MKDLSPKLDIVFQALFGEVGSEKITKSFLEAILNEKIDSIDLSKNPIIRKECPSDKLGILDVVATINGKEPCNIEMQIESKNSLVERNLFYWSKRYSSQAKSGIEYGNLHRTISILITDFTLDTIKDLDYHTTWKIMEEENRQVLLTDKFEFHIINLSKIIRKRK